MTYSIIQCDTGWPAPVFFSETFQTGLAGSTVLSGRLAIIGAFKACRSGALSRLIDSISAENKESETKSSGHLAFQMFSNLPEK